MELEAWRVDDVLERVRAAWAPPPELTVSQFADQEIVIASGPMAGTRWQTDFAPYQRGILDAIHEGAQFIIVQGSSQWGKTACAVNIVAYHIAHDPCEILVVEPTVDPMAKDFAKNRLDPTIKASPRLNAVVDKRRQKDASNTTLLKTFRGGMLALAGSNSAASLAARPVRLLVLDEVDRYERQLKGEGDTISIAIKRTTTFRSRRRVLMLSSPTVVGAPIQAWFERGDQRRYYVPCPSCGLMQAFTWKQVKWTDDDPSTARLICPGCAHAIDEAERVAILGRGEWRATNPTPERGVISFHLWEAYSPLSSLSEIVAGFLRARAAQKAGDQALMHTWQNTTLGEPVEPDKGDGAEPHELLTRREPFEAEIPAGACCITAGVDTQDDRLEVLVIGWGPGEEAWIVDRQVLPGDTSQPEPWAQLDELLAYEYVHASGVKLPVSAACIDSAGHRTTMVYDYAMRQAARRVYAVIGRDGQRPIVSAPSPRKWGRNQRQVPLYTIGVDAAKALIVSRLRLKGDATLGRQPGFIHLPLAHWCDEELAAQLTSERLVTKFARGVAVSTWVKTRPRNEALDMAVYALAALRLLNPKLEDLAERLAKPAGAPPPAATHRPSTWLGPRRSSWLRGGR